MQNLLSFERSESHSCDLRFNQNQFTFFVTGKPPTRQLQNERLYNPNRFVASSSLLLLFHFRFEGRWQGHCVRWRRGQRIELQGMFGCFVSSFNHFISKYRGHHWKFAKKIQNYFWVVLRGDSKKNIPGWFWVSVMKTVDSKKTGEFVYLFRVIGDSIFFILLANFFPCVNSAVVLILPSLHPAWTASFSSLFKSFYRKIKLRPRTLRVISHQRPLLELQLRLKKPIRLVRLAWMEVMDLATG